MSGGYLVFLLLLVTALGIASERHPSDFQHAFTVGFIATVAIYVAGGIVIGAFGVDNSVSSAMRSLMGRKRLNRKAFIPVDLQAGMDPLPKRDPDLGQLNNYKPGEATPLRRPRVVFKGPVEPTLAPAKSHHVIDIATVRNALRMSTALPYAQHAVVPELPRYPVDKPTPPEPAADVPYWTPWRPTFEEPSFVPPYWGGRLAALNRFVEEAYKDEIARFAAACARKRDYEARCNQRNQKLTLLAQQAEQQRVEFNAKRQREYTEAVAAWEADAEAYRKAAVACRQEAQARIDRLSAPGRDGLLARIDLAMRAIEWPAFMSGESETRLDVDSGVLIHEHRFPDPSAIEWVKTVTLKSGPTVKAANKTEAKEACGQLHPTLCLRLAAELLRLDSEGFVKAMAVNGWADYIDKSTGQERRAYCASLFATRDQIESLNLRSVDPIAAFSALKGLSARTMELTPIAPIMRLDTNDPRFVDPKEVLSKLAEGENLAVMDWEDFEHLCRELFERAFAGSGAEVKVTQASRDQGVDAVVFDPDPIRGGKIVIQAKRYTNTVDVSAVRDLYGAVQHEGANKGILVTTSHFGPDAYSFAKDKPLTLLNGAELLGLLEKHGYKFRIDVSEAKDMLRSQGR